MSKLQDEFHQLSRKTPISEENLVKLHQLKAEIDALTRKMDTLMDDLENTFMNAKAFSSLSPEQKKELLKLLTQFKNNEKQIARKNSRIDKVFAGIKTPFVHGDANTDGVVDQKDFDVLQGLMGKFPIRKGEAGYRRVLDLDGNGVLGQTDINLMRQYVQGNRTFFPVDPACPSGDMNGDGEITAQDVRRMASALVHNLGAKSARSKVADVNGDGRFTYHDVVALTQKLPNAPKMPENLTKSDVNLDGKFDAKDMIKLLELATLGDETVDPATLKRADLNGDGKIDVLDIQLMSKLAESFKDADQPQPEPAGDEDSTPQETPAGDAAETGDGSADQTGTGQQPSSNDLLDR